MQHPPRPLQSSALLTCPSSAPYPSPEGTGSPTEDSVELIDLEIDILARAGSVSRAKEHQLS